MTLQMLKKKKKKTLSLAKYVKIEISGKMLKWKVQNNNSFESRVEIRMH